LRLSNGRVLIVNPPKNYRLRKDDYLFVMCQEEVEEF